MQRVEKVNFSKRNLALFIFSNSSSEARTYCMIRESVMIIGIVVIYIEYGWTRPFGWALICLVNSRSSGLQNVKATSQGDKPKWYRILYRFSLERCFVIHNFRDYYVLQKSVLSNLLCDTNSLYARLAQVPKIRVCFPIQKQLFCRYKTGS